MKKSTEIYVNLMLLEETPDYVLQVLYDLCEPNMGISLCLGEYDKYWGLFTNKSPIVPCTEAKVFNDFNGSYSLMGKGDTYDKELVISFFRFISQYSATEFMGYYLREEFVERNRVYVSRPWSYMGITYEEYEDFLQGKVYATDEMLLGLEEIIALALFLEEI